MRLKKNEFSIEEAIKLWQENYRHLVKITPKDILENWRSIVGDTIANQTIALSIHQQTLYLKVAHPLWKKELAYHTETIQNKVNQFAQCELITKVIIS